MLRNHLFTYVSCIFFWWPKPSHESPAHVFPCTTEPAGGGRPGQLRLPHGQEAGFCLLGLLAKEAGSYNRQALAWPVSCATSKPLPHPAPPSWRQLSSASCPVTWVGGGGGDMC